MKKRVVNLFITLPLASIGLYIFLLAAAIVSYNGGNSIDYHGIGYSFSLNFLSDLGRYSGYAGQDNSLSFYSFNLSLVTIGIAFLAYFIFLSIFTGWQSFWVFCKHLFYWGRSDPC